MTPHLQGSGLEDKRGEREGEGERARGLHLNGSQLQKAISERHGAGGAGRGVVSTADESLPRCDEQVGRPQPQLRVIREKAPREAVPLSAAPTNRRKRTETVLSDLLWVQRLPAPAGILKS